MAVNDLDESIRWYTKTFGLEFSTWTYTGGVGYIADTIDHNCTIRYASAKLLHQGSIDLVETKRVPSLVHVPYSIQVANSYELYNSLNEKNIKLSDFVDEGDIKTFNYFDIDGNEIRVVENRSQ